MSDECAVDSWRTLPELPGPARAFIEQSGDTKNVEPLPPFRSLLPCMLAMTS